MREFLYVIVDLRTAASGSPRAWPIVLAALARALRHMFLLGRTRRDREVFASLLPFAAVGPALPALMSGAHVRADAEALVARVEELATEAAARARPVAGAGAELAGVAAVVAHWRAVRARLRRGAAATAAAATAAAATVAYFASPAVPGDAEGLAALHGAGFETRFFLCCGDGERDAAAAHARASALLRPFASCSHWAVPPDAAAAQRELTRRFLQDLVDHGHVELRLAPGVAVVAAAQPRLAPMLTMLAGTAIALPPVLCAEGTVPFAAVLPDLCFGVPFVLRAAPDAADAPFVAARVAALCRLLRRERCVLLLSTRAPHADAADVAAPFVAADAARRRRADDPPPLQDHVQYFLATAEEEGVAALLVRGVTGLEEVLPLLALPLAMGLPPQATAAEHETVERALLRLPRGDLLSLMGSTEWGC